MKRVLFVCTGNTCRSPMAQLLFNKLAVENGTAATAQSAGLCTIDGLPISDNSGKALKEIGVDSDFFRSTDIFTLDLDAFDLVVGMTPEHLAELKALGIEDERLLLLNENGGGIKDPYGSSLDVYRLCRDEILNSLDQVRDRL